jgi:ribosomal protein S18 acetylase RimI-like enzyme
MTIDDYDEWIRLLRGTSGVTIREADSREAIARYLEHNPGMSFVAQHEGRIIGCIMSGHDGRRGYLQHLVVHRDFRGRGTGRALVEKCLGKLELIGIMKSHVDVLVSNSEAARFWERIGWKKRNDIYRYSIIRNSSKNA